MKINIATEFSKIPGGRHEAEGNYSGELFRKTILLPKYIEAVNKNEKLYIDLDGGYGYGSSFLEEAFGGLVRDLKENHKNILKIKNILEVIEIKSDEEPIQKEKIKEYIKLAIKG